ncbi:MAG: Gfo/Idh/MocA family oxidoreductase [Sedimentisphaerales bacterium]|nr:Gfo/Idh/MocA family oxidoreductase [Sedimentisphaerales bacterium]
MQQSGGFSRRRFLQTTAAAAAFTIVPRHVIGQGQTPPSDTFGGALIGCGGRGNGTFEGLGPNVNKVAICDVKFLDHADNKKVYTDFRRVLERKDIDVVAIATPPHWHALISIAAMEAGKDVLCEKPMTHFIAEGRAVAETERRTGRIFQVGTYGRFSADRNKRKIMTSGLLKKNPVVHIHRGGFKVKEWSGMINPKPQPVPKSLDWNMYCGPSPLRPFHPHRFGGSHRGYWDYEGGGLTDMGQHYFDGFQYMYGKDNTSPIEIEPYAPPAHPEACGMWGWVEMKYTDGLTLVFDSQEWGKPYDRMQPRDISINDLAPEDREKLKAMPDPEPLVSFPDAIRTRKRAGGNADVSHRCVCLMHLANIAIRVGRKIQYDPIREVILGDEQANRLVNQPMRTPWHL